MDVERVIESHLQRGMYVQHDAHAIQLVYVEPHRVTATAKHSPIGVGRNVHNPTSLAGSGSPFLNDTEAGSQANERFAP